MAPESERANTDANSFKCPRGIHETLTTCLADSGCNVIDSANWKPTLTCSEVVERLVDCQLIKECIDRAPLDPESQTELLSDICDALSKHAEAILHSWRDRRVQELEEALMKSDSYLSLLRHRANIPWGTTGFPQQGDVDQVIGTSRKLLANSEWREQIRKGAKHESGL